MESCFCAAAAAVYVLTAAWWLAGRRAARWPALLGALGATLYFAVPAGLCGAALLACSLALVLAAAGKGELLPAAGRAVLITGCDSGFGEALAALLSESGVQVFAGVLDASGAGAQRLRRRGGDKLQVLQLDVTDGGQVEAALQHVRAQVGDAGLWGLVNNAGVLYCAIDAELQPITWYRRCMDVNFLSAVRMCQAFLPLLRRRHGRIVNVSSLAGQVPLPMFAAYGSSKAALSVFSRVLRLELSMWGVDVALIEPTGFRTNILGSSDDITRHQDEVLRGLSCEAREDYGEAYASSVGARLSEMSGQLAADLSPVLDAMRDALLSPRPRALYTPGRMGWFLPFLHRHLPTAMFDAIITRGESADREPARRRLI